MRSSLVLTVVLAVVSSALASAHVETIGLTTMRRERPSITGVGIPVAIPEGQESTNAWQVNPAVNPAPAYTWTSAQGTATTFPNSVGVQSSHANSVAHHFFGTGPGGVAPGVSRVHSFDASHFYSSVIIGKQPIAAQVVNQSFIFNADPSLVDPVYNDYANLFNVVIVSGMNNIPGTPPPAGTAHNVIGVGIFSTNAQSSTGPTADGRAKPDLVAPDSCCASFSTPQVSGAAALLLQAARANDAGPGTAALATNASVIKSLLINGAVKPPGWTNGVVRPLDARWGSGVLNVYNSDWQLRGGRRAATATNSVPAGSVHPPVNTTNNVNGFRGWDFSTIQSTVISDLVAHYYFNLPTHSEAYSATITLVWKKGNMPLSNLDLFLYDTAGNTLVTNSISAVDNVEHIFIPRLPAGRYALQVLKPGGMGAAGSEPYALAWDFSPAELSIARAGTNVVVSWPASPAGYALQGSPTLHAPIPWQTILQPTFLSNAMNTLTLPATNGHRFFRLCRP